MFLFEIFEKVAVSTKAVFASDRVFENEVFERGKSESHITAKENEEANSREIGASVPHWGEADDGVKNGLAENNSGVKSDDVNKEDGFFGDPFVGVENKWDKEDEDEKTHELGAEIVGVGAVVVTVVKGPD